MKQILTLKCPHCQEYFEVAIQDLNCKIFRHAEFKSGQQVNPHASREQIKIYKSLDLIYGCGGPFRLVQQEEIYVPLVCDYSE